MGFLKFQLVALSGPFTIFYINGFPFYSITI